MTTRDISEQVKELYGVDVSAETVSNITNKILPLVAEWQSRPLEKTYSFVFMDAIHYWSALNFTDTLLFFHMHRKPSNYNVF